MALVKLPQMQTDNVMSTLPMSMNASRARSRPNDSRNRRNRNLLSVEDTPIPILDYDLIKWINDIDGLKGRHVKNTSEDAHNMFMENYHRMFVKPTKKVGLPIHMERRIMYRSSQSSVTHKATGPTTEDRKTKKAVEQFPSHNIRDYLPLLHKQRKSEDPAAVKEENYRTLRKLLRKLPFERSAVDNDRIYSILKTFDFFKENIPANILKELCVVMISEQWKDTDFTVFGNNGLHMILKGTATPLTYPHFYTGDGSVIFRDPTPILHEDPQEILHSGEVFGTLKKVEGREASTRILSVVTCEPNCEFLVISASDYNRVIEQIKHREHTEKVNLLLSCGQYKLWPRQPLLKVANLIEWINYPPNTVLVSEGYKAPYIAFIKSGHCHVLRQVDVMQTLKNGKREKRTKQVVMGKLETSESFAELSILLDEPITCSIVTATSVELGIIKPESIKALDEVTIQLFKQSNTHTFGDLTKENIQDEYMEQEMKREWNEFKHGVVVDVINSKGIRPGYGKWAK
ncbi:hypothetical protein ScPMuIL_002016 [Solemya velum]